LLLAVGQVVVGLDWVVVGAVVGVVEKVELNWVVP
jgi:hypothetical protein